MGVIIMQTQGSPTAIQSWVLIFSVAKRSVISVIPRILIMKLFIQGVISQGAPLLFNLITFIIAHEWKLKTVLFTEGYLYG